MTRFADRLARMEGAVAREHGELTRIEPRLAGEFVAGAADPDRPTYEAIGVVDETPVISRMRQRMGDSSADAADLRSDMIEVFYQASVLGPRARWPRANDGIVRLELPGKPRLLVSKVDPDGLSGVVCRCVREKAATE